MATGWIIASAPDESSAIDQFYDGDEFSSEINASSFFSANAGATINTMRQEEGTLQTRFDDREVVLRAATQTVVIAADSNVGNGWIIASAPDEGSAVDQYFDGEGFTADIDSSEVLSKAEGFTVEQARQEEGTAQNRFDDVDIRLLPVTGTVALV